MRPEATAAAAALTPRDLVLTVRDLPSPPEAYFALSRVLDRPDWQTREVVAIVEQEPALTARILRLANSPYYGLGRQVAGVGEAVTLVGSEEVRNLVLVTTVLSGFSLLPSNALSPEDFWRRALRVAIGARLLAAEGRCRRQAGELFVAGLLHDLGSLVVCLAAPELARQALLHGWDDGEAPFSIERAALGCAEAAVGRELLRHWRLPLLLEQAVGFHPTPAAAGDHEAAAATVQLAVWLAVAVEEGLDLDARLAPDHPLWRLAGVDPAVTSGLAPALRERHAAAVSAFGL